MSKSKLVMSGTSVPVECFLVLLLFLSGILVVRLDGTTDTMDTVRVWNAVITAALSMSCREPGVCMSETFNHDYLLLLLLLLPKIFLPYFMYLVSFKSFIEHQ